MWPWPGPLRLQSAGPAGALSNHAHLSCVMLTVICPKTAGHRCPPKNSRSEILSLPRRRLVVMCQAAFTKSSSKLPGDGEFEYRILSRE